MPRPPRIAPAGVCFHVLNRGNSRQKLFRKDADYLAFLAILTEAVARFKVDLFAWCLMPNHWHLVLRPRSDTALSAFMAWLSITHVRRHHGHYPASSGHLYQGRFKSFPVEADDYFLVLCRYVEANPLRANLVDRAERWRWSSLGSRSADGVDQIDPTSLPALTDWPVDRPRNWVAVVNAAMEKALLEKVTASVDRDRPLGADRWSRRTCGRLKLDQTLHPHGRPRKPMRELSKRSRQRREQERQNGR